MRSRAIRCASFFLILLCASASFAISSGVVISQVYGGGGNAGAVYTNDFVELFNRGSATVSLGTYSIQYTSATGTGNFSANVKALSGSIAPGQYYLVQLAAGGTPVAALPAPDATGTINMSGTGGKVILANITAGIACNGSSTPCTATQLSQIVDLVGWGAANFSETAAAPVTTNGTAVIRKSNGCTETDNNSADFVAAVPTPRNTTSPVNLCSPLPALSITDVTLNEGNAGTTTFSFTVNLSAPALAGGVTFDIATADDTAVAPGDYTAKSLAAQTIPAGSSSYTFDVLVNGDTTGETNERFFVNVANISGATAADPQGLGTITDDDLPKLSINDVTQNEGDAGTSMYSFAVSLSLPAPAAGVTFDIATADNTATVADNDYVSSSLLAQTIPAGSSTYTFNVTVNGDANVEANETFFVNVLNVNGANVLDAQGLGTITNDDFTPIHDIQGTGASSPLVGATVTTKGIVTGRKSNGFFIQEPDASVDADPATSEGVFVFTSAAPPAAATVGNLVSVNGKVAEFVPSTDAMQPPMTELSSPVVSLISSGNPLPAAVSLTATFPDPAGSVTQLERLEGMRVSVASVTVVGPTDGFLSEANATSTSDGSFYAVVTGVPRPFRAAGIQADDTVPSGTIPPIPRFDANPELIRVDSDAIGGTAIDVSATAIVTNLVGPLDYAYRTYTIDQEPATVPSVSGGKTPAAVSAEGPHEFTVATFNVERFYDTVNDLATSDVPLNGAAFNGRLNKASLAIRNYLLMPDIIGIEEMENLTTLQALAAKISSDAVAASQPDPQYVAYLEEGNDIGGIDVGFLVKTAAVTGATPRVTVNAVVQENKAETWIDPADNAPHLLNDRPPLRLDAVVNEANGNTFPVTVIANHLRSLGGISDESADLLTTTGDRVRKKRLAQAASLANLVQTRQLANPAEKIVLLGDFNAFEFNDGYADVVNTIAGTPPPDNETVVPGDGIDLVNPDLTNLVNTPPAAERYSYSFGGNAQNLDHIIVNQALMTATTARRLEHARIDADFPETARNDVNSALRLSDHDPGVAYFSIPQPGTLSLAAGYSTSEATGTFDVTVTRTDGSDGPVSATYTVAIGAGTASLGDFTAATGTISFATGETSKTFPVTIANDAIDEPDETLELTLSAPTGGAKLGTASAMLTIVDDDAPPQLAIADVSVLETAGMAHVAVTLSGQSAQTVTVDYATSNGAATAGADYTSGNGTLTFAPFVTAQEIQVPILNDSLVEGNEIFNVSLSNAAGASLADGSSVVTIVDDDAPQPIVTISDASIAEGNSGVVSLNFTVTVNTPVPAMVHADYATSDGTATAGSDYDATAGPIVLHEGTNTISVPIHGDAVYEGDETFTLTLSNVLDGVVADGTATGTILDDDTADLTLTSTMTPLNPALGDTVTFHLTLHNNGPADATNVVVTDAIPANATFLSAAASQGTCSGTGPVTCDAGTLANGATMTIDIVIKLPNGPGTFTNTVTATSAVTDPTIASASTTFAPAVVTAIPAVSDLGLLLLALALAVLAMTKIRT